MRDEIADNTPRIIPWWAKFRTRFYREGHGWFCSMYLGVLAVTVQWRYSFIYHTIETTGMQIAWIPLDAVEGELLKVFCDLTRKRAKVQEYCRER